MIDVLHIREKERPAREQIEWFHTLQALLPDAQIYINDRLDAAFAVHARGVQLAWHSIGVQSAKRLMQPGCRIGCSVHNVQEAVNAQSAGADFVLFGHVYETASKAGLAGRGAGALRTVVEAVSLPVIALGGITSSNVSDVMKTGCAGVAVMSAFFMNMDDESELIKIRYELDKRRL
jgi:thiamine-phosphate diphosphorylase